MKKNEEWDVKDEYFNEAISDYDCKKRGTFIWRYL